MRVAVLLLLALLGFAAPASGADLTIAALPTAHSQANVKSKAPLESIFSSGPLIPTFAKVRAAVVCECWNRTASADDVANAQAVIRAQEQAFGRNDAAAAYSYAAPAIKELFPRADIFMRMVQNSYAPVWRHRSFEFGETRVEGKWVAQRVHIVDSDGEAWEAIYTLEQDADASFEITGCSLLKAGQSV